MDQGLGGIPFLACEGQSWAVAQLEPCDCFWFFIPKLNCLLGEFLRGKKSTQGKIIQSPELSNTLRIRVGLVFGGSEFLNPFVVAGNLAGEGAVGPYFNLSNGLVKMLNEIGSASAKR